MEDIKYTPSYVELSTMYIQRLDHIAKIVEFWINVREQCPADVQARFEALFKELNEDIDETIIS